MREQFLRTGGELIHELFEPIGSLIAVPLHIL